MWLEMWVGGVGYWEVLEGFWVIGTGCGLGLTVFLGVKLLIVAWDLDWDVAWDVAWGGIGKCFG